MDIFLNKYLRKCGCLIVLQAVSTFDARLRDDYKFVGGEKRLISFVYLCICICIWREILGAGLYFAVRGSWCRVPTRVLRWFAACQGRGPGPPLFWSTTQPFTFRPFYFAFCYLPFAFCFYFGILRLPLLLILLHFIFT